MKAWWAYWLTLIVGIALWVGVALALGRDGLRVALGQPVWVLVLDAPIVLAGLNLLVFRGSHEVICRLEAERHPWLATLVGRGYSARMFALTGAVLLTLTAGLVLAAITS
jgi:hypothetical protein